MQGVPNQNQWSVAQEFEYENGNKEWIAEFEIELECSDNSFLFLRYKLHKGELNLIGID